MHIATVLMWYCYYHYSSDSSKVRKGILMDEGWSVSVNGKKATKFNKLLLFSTLLNSLNFSSKYC
jgi:hypothetical protein